MELIAQQQDTVRKPTGTLQIANQYSLVERKLMNVLIWHGQQTDFRPDVYDFPVSDVLQLIGCESTKNWEWLKDAIRGLVGKTIEWNTMGVDNTHVWGVCTFLAGGLIYRGRLRYRVNPEIIERIRHPELFAKFKLMVQSRLTSRYSLILYEFLVDAVGRCCKEDVIEVEDRLESVRRLLGIEPKEYQEFKYFNKDVLKPALKELNKLTDLQVTCQLVREKRRVVRLRFLASREGSFQLPLELENPTAVQRVAEPRRPPTLVALLIDEGIGKRTVAKLVKTFDEVRIRENLDHVHQLVADGRDIKNRPAYLVKAIEEDYRPRKSPADVRSERAAKSKAEERRRWEETKAIKENLKEAYDNFRQLRVSELFGKLPEAQKQTKRDRFIKEQVEAHALFGRQYQRKGWTKAIESMFRGSLYDELLTKPEETEFTVFCRWWENGGRAQLGPTP